MVESGKIEIGEIYSFAPLKLEYIKNEKVEKILSFKNLETREEKIFKTSNSGKFPITGGNIPEYENKIDFFTLGITNVVIDDFYLPNVAIRIAVYSDFRVLEIKTREFRFSVSAAVYKGNIIKKYGNYFEYEVFKRVKIQRLLEVIEIFEKIFNGGLIRFSLKNISGLLSVPNAVELNKITLLKNLLYESSINLKKMALLKNGNLYGTDFSIYELYILNNYLKNNIEYSTFVDFELKQSSGESLNTPLTFSRTHLYKNLGKIFYIEENFYFESDGIDSGIKHRGKKVKVSLNKIEKN